MREVSGFTMTKEPEIKLVLFKIRTDYDTEHWIWECDFCKETSRKTWPIEETRVAEPLADYYMHIWTKHRNDGSIKGPIEIKPTGDVL